MKKKKVAIVIPTHKNSFNSDEKKSLLHLKTFLGKYDKYFVTPQKLNPKKFPKDFKVIKFEDHYFTSVRKYCELLMTKDFYENFKNYEYILIYQTDVLVFSDQISQWCKRGYDYVGAPWFHPVIGFLTHSKDSPFHWKMATGNGGFSLRKVDTAIKVLENMDKDAERNTASYLLRKLWFFTAILTGKSHQKWMKSPASCYPYSEDGFWSFEAPKYYSKYKVAPAKEALSFAFEINPRKCFELNNRQLPFGCHAWAKYDREFWNRYLLQTKVT